MPSPRQQPDPEAYLDLVFNANTSEQTEFRMTRFNSSLYTFVGKTAIEGGDIDNQNFNHIFMHREEEGETVGRYMFVTPQTQELFNSIAGFMLKHEFPAVINQNEVPECDRIAWAKAQTQDLGDYIPDEWRA